MPLCSSSCGCRSARCGAKRETAVTHHAPECLFEHAAAHLLLEGLGDEAALRLQEPLALLQGWVHDFDALQLKHSPATLTSLIQVQPVQRLGRDMSVHDSTRHAGVCWPGIASKAECQPRQLQHVRSTCLQAYGALNEAGEAVALLQRAGGWVAGAGGPPVAQAPAYGAALVAAVRTFDTPAIASIEVVIALALRTENIESEDMKMCRTT
jgi:hypothetical protein